MMLMDLFLATKMLFICSYVQLKGNVVACCVIHGERVHGGICCLGPLQVLKQAIWG